MDLDSEMKRMRDFMKRAEPMLAEWESRHRPLEEVLAEAGLEHGPGTIPVPPVPPMGRNAMLLRRGIR